ncbi:MAG: cation:proton antiporter [Chlamydiales bacterium]
MEIPLLKELLTIIILSIGVLLICHRLKLPNIVGFLLTGVICGPYGLGFVRNVTEVEHLANIGIVLLLFTVGLEFSFRKILEYKRYFFLGGGIQVGLTVLIGTLIGQSLGRPLNESLFLGCLLSLSSTAIVLRLLQERKEISSSHGKLCLGILIFQDLIVIPMLLLIPFLTGKKLSLDFGVLTAIIQAIIVLFIVFVTGVWIVPKLLDLISRTRSRELFILSILGVCFSVAWAVSMIGLTLSIGAFLAGLTLSESEYKLRAIGDMIPLQDIFSSFFFVSIGMLLDVDFLWRYPFFITSLTIGVFLLKFGIVSITSFIIGIPLRTTIMTAFALSQIGEFSFILIKSGFEMGIGTFYYFQLFLAVSVLTMIITPLCIQYSWILSSWFLKLPLPEKIKLGFRSEPEKLLTKLENHVIIIGYGFCGKNLARSCLDASVPFLVIDIDHDTVKEEKKKGIPILFGDATHEFILKHAHIEEANAVAVLLNDFVASTHIVTQARMINPNIYIIVRTQYLEQVNPLLNSGADIVIPDEFGSSVEIFMNVLEQFHVPKEKINELISDARSEAYERLEHMIKSPRRMTGFPLTSLDIPLQMFIVMQGSSVEGKSVGELDLNNRYQVSIILVRRKGKTVRTLVPEFRLEAEDKVFLLGERDKLELLEELFQNEQREQ